MRNEIRETKIKYSFFRLSLECFQLRVAVTIIYGSSSSGNSLIAVAVVFVVIEVYYVPSMTNGTGLKFLPISKRSMS